MSDRRRNLYVLGTAVLAIVFIGMLLPSRPSHVDVLASADAAPRGGAAEARAGAGQAAQTTSPASSPAAEGRTPEDADATEWDGPGHLQGRLDAPVTMIEFSDFGCQYCAQFALSTYPALYEEFVATGLVRWIYIPFVLGPFPNAAEAALAAECAAETGTDAFWAMHDRLYAEQRSWKAERAPEGLFQRVAVEAGVDAAAFEACYEEARPRARIAASNHLAREAQVRATPTFFVHGQRVEGALPLPLFRQVLEEAVAAAGGADLRRP